MKVGTTRLLGSLLLTNKEKWMIGNTSLFSWEWTYITRCNYACDIIAKVKFTNQNLISKVFPCVTVYKFARNLFEICSYWDKIQFCLWSCHQGCQDQRSRSNNRPNFKGINV